MRRAVGLGQGGGAYSARGITARTARSRAGLIHLRLSNSTSLARATASRVVYPPRTSSCRITLGRSARSGYRSAAAA